MQVWCMNAKRPAEGRKHKVNIQGWDFFLFFFLYPVKHTESFLLFLYARTWNPNVHKHLEKCLKLTSSVP